MTKNILSGQDVSILFSFRSGCWFSSHSSSFISHQINVVSCLDVENSFTTEACVSLCMFFALVEQILNRFLAETRIYIFKE